MKPVLTLFFCLLAIVSVGQIDYSMLYENSISGKKLKDTVVSTFEKGPNVFELHQITDSISFFTSVYLQDQGEYPIVPTYIKIYNDSFDLKPMFSDDSSLSYGVSYMDGYFFNYEDEEFLLVFLINANANCHWCENLTLIFNISDKRKIVLCYNGFQKCPELHILGTVGSSLVLFPLAYFDRSLTPLWYKKDNKKFIAKAEYKISIDIDEKTYAMSINKKNSSWPFFK